MQPSLRLLVILAILVSSSVAARAAWLPDGVAVSAAPDRQDMHSVAADGAGGVIVTWRDYRSGTNFDIYAQRVNASGTPLWTANGVAVCTAPGDQLWSMIASDGDRGAIITWHDLRSGPQSYQYDVYAQQVDASGTPQWPVDGVALCKAPDDQYQPTIVPDGLGGAIVAWHDERGTEPHIYAQRVDTSGIPQWGEDGVAVCTAVGGQVYTRIAADGAGGAIITWMDYRNSPVDVYAQRMDASGVPQWTPDGVAVATSSSQIYPEIVSDGMGGAIIAWGDADIFAQRVDASGVVQWGEAGVAVCADVNDQSAATLVSDGDGGAIFTWWDFRSGPYGDIYAQRVHAGGTPQWTANGVALCTDPYEQRFPTIVSDGAGGAIVTWQDLRSGTTYDIYARRIDASGTPQWTADGVALCTAVEHQVSPLIVPVEDGGAIVTWYDYVFAHPNLINQDIYTQRVSADGSIPTGVGDTPSTFGLAVTRNYPNPFSVGTTIELSLPADAAVEMEVFDATGRRVRAMNPGRMSAGLKEMSFDGRDDMGRPLASGVYFCRVRAAGQVVTRKIVITR